jgi:hypothetical protein
MAIRTILDYQTPYRNHYDNSIPSWTEGAIASIGESFEQLPSVAGGRAQALAMADQELFPLSIEEGTAAYEDLYAPRQTVSEEVWKGIEYDGQKVSSLFKYEPDHTEEYWNLKAELKSAEIRRQETIAKSEIGALSQFALALPLQFIDPINLAASFIPVSRIGPLGRMLGTTEMTVASTASSRAAYFAAREAGKDVAGATAGAVAGAGLQTFGKRLAAGAIEGTVGNVAPEVMTYFALTGDRDYDYDHYNLLSNLAMGGVAGAGLHGILGRGGIKRAKTEVLDSVHSDWEIEFSKHIDGKKIDMSRDAQYQEFKNSKPVRDYIDKLTQKDYARYTEAMDAGEGVLERMDTEKFADAEYDLGDDILQPIFYANKMGYIKNLDDFFSKAYEGTPEFDIIKAKAAGLKAEYEQKVAGVTELTQKQKTYGEYTKARLDEAEKVNIYKYTEAERDLETRIAAATNETERAGLVSQLNLLIKTKNDYINWAVKNRIPIDLKISIDKMTNKSLALQTSIRKLEQDIKDVSSVPGNLEYVLKRQEELDTQKKQLEDIQSKILEKTEKLKVEDPKLYEAHQGVTDLQKQIDVMDEEIVGVRERSKAVKQEAFALKRGQKETDFDFMNRFISELKDAMSSVGGIDFAGKISKSFTEFHLRFGSPGDLNKTIRAFFGEEYDGKKLFTPQYQEIIQRSLARYLEMDEAFAAEARDVFTHFTTWAYQTYKNTNAVSDEMKKMFDRWHGYYDDILPGETRKPTYESFDLNQGPGFHQYSNPNADVRPGTTTREDVYSKYDDLAQKKDVNGDLLISPQMKDYVTTTMARINKRYKDDVAMMDDLVKNLKDNITSKEAVAKTLEKYKDEIKDPMNKQLLKTFIKRLEGGGKKGLSYDKINEIMKGEMFEHAKQQQTTSMWSVVRDAEMKDKITTLVKSGDVNEAEVLLGEMLGHTELGYIGKTKHYDGLKNSVDSRTKGLQRMYLGRLKHELVKANLWKMVEQTRSGNPWVLHADKKFQLQILDALRSVDLKTGKVTLTDNKEASDVAQIIFNLNKELIDLQNRAGANIHMIEDYGMRQTHDRHKLTKGNNARERWKSFVLDKIDIEKTFGGKSSEEIGEVLNKIYKHITTGGSYKRGYDTDFNSDYNFHFPVDKGTTTLADKINSERQLIFKDADAQFAYNTVYGRGDVMDNIFSNIMNASRNIALMEKFGPDPEGVFNSLLNWIRSRTDKNPELEKALLGRKGKWLQSAFDDISGKSSIPGDIGLARWGRSVRAINNITKLGGAMLSSLGDIGTVADELMYQGVSFTKAYATAFGNIGRIFSKSSDRQEAARLLGIGLDSMIGDVISRWSDPSDIPGWLSKAMSLMFKLNGLEQWTDSHKYGVGMMMSANIAKYKDYDWDGLAKSNKKLHNLFRQYGFDAVDWEVIRTKGIGKLGDNDFVLGELLDGVSNNDIVRLARSKLRLGNVGRKATTSELDSGIAAGETWKIRDDDLLQINAYRQDLAGKFRAFMVDRTDYAVPTPGARQRITMRGGTEAGSAWGEVNRFFWQFKSFPLTLQQHIVEKGSWGSFGHLLISLTALGYGSMVVKDFLKDGKEPRTDRRAFVDAMVQGGVLGFAGDLLLSETKRYGQSPIARQFGPTLGLVEDIGKLYYGFVGGDKNLGGNAVFFAKRHMMPGYSLPIVKWVLDYTMLHSLQETLTPGYLDRMERRLEKERDQSYIFPPSRYRWRTFE